MSWSTSRIVTPVSTIWRRRSPSSDRLVGVEAGGGLVHADQLRRRGERARHADELALALADLVRHAVAEVADPECDERAFDRVVIAPASRPDEVEQHVAPRRRLGGDHQVLGDGEVVEQLDGLPRAPEAGARPPVGGERARSTRRRT